MEELGGRALVVRSTSPTTTRSRRPPSASSGSSGPIDVWVNDAMATVFAKVIDTDAPGVPAGHRGHLSRHRQRHDGRAEADDARVTAATIIQVGSALSYRAIPLQAAYCGAKFGIRGFTDSLRVELRADKSHVRITMVQLPGVNTTQFNWCRSKMPDHPQPVPPIYQPEIPAEAVYWAAHHRRRELWVGYSAVQAIVGTRRSAPPLADIYLARTASGPADGRPAGRPATVPTTCSSPNRSWRPRTASSTTRPSSAARSCGPRPTGGCLVGAVRGGGCGRRRRRPRRRVGEIVSGARSRTCAATAYRIPTERPGVRRHAGVGCGDRRRRRGRRRRPDRDRLHLRRRRGRGADRAELAERRPRRRRLRRPRRVVGDGPRDPQFRLATGSARPRSPPSTWRCGISRPGCWASAWPICWAAPTRRCRCTARGG